ncbi:MAG: BCCT family transporter, partial [Brevibacterium aurantiacum]
LATALPFSIILIFIAISMVRAFQIEATRAREIETGQRFHEVGEHIADDFDEYLGDKVDARIDYRLSRTKGVLNRAPKEERKPKGSR